jgi:hypothetical protein
LCQSRVANIHSFYEHNRKHAFRPFPQNGIPETDIPMFSRDQHKDLTAYIYARNTNVINVLVDKIF